MEDKMDYLNRNDSEWNREFRNMMLKRLAIGVGVIGLAVGGYFYLRNNDTIENKVVEPTPIVIPIQRDFYIAKKGDTWKKIGKYEKLSVDSLKAYNPEVEKIMIGDTIYTSR